MSAAGKIAPRIENETNPPAVEAAVALIASHRRVQKVSRPCPAGSPGWFGIEARIRLELPFKWMARGLSPNGVRAVEPVTFSFPPAYPVHAPTVILREDFDRSLAHVQPGPSDGPVIPCLVDGNLDEFLHSRGLLAIVDQLVTWLEKAAMGMLIDPGHGWEPVRRDSLEDLIVADAYRLRGLVSRQESHAFFPFSYLAAPEGARGNRVVHGYLHTERLTVNKKTLEDKGFFQERRIRADLSAGRCLALVVTPGKLPSGQLHAADQYRPETVTDLAGVKERAAEYGCATSLGTALKWLGQCVADFTSQGATFPFAVILCARRPFPLIGQASNIELVPYIVHVGAPELFAAGDRTPVFPAAHLHSVSPDLLRRMSGEPLVPEGRDIVLLGCGSLGSKIGIHLARAGAAPARVVDRRFLSPHNAARHALLPQNEGLQLTWMGNKADAMAQAIEGFGQSAKAFGDDVTLALHDEEVRARLFPRRTWAVVNATASLAVREALSAIDPERLKGRVIETSLLARGAIGVMSAEGPDRNPNCADLAAEAYEALRVDERLREAVFEGEEPTLRQEIGEGCGSMTMAIPDARISLFAAAMAQGIATMRVEGLPGAGRVLIGQSSGDGMGLTWIARDVPPVRIVPAEGEEAWTVRLSHRASETIGRDYAAHPDVETGGILVGRISETQRAFLVTDVLPAPEDSVRSPSEFTLGTRGVLRMLENYSRACGLALYCLGTWHSHLTGSGPSDLDRQTASTLAIARAVPSVLLIRMPSGYRALLAKRPVGTGQQEGA